MAAQREWFEKDYYKVLGVAEDAAPKDITKAYRKLARENHPDTHPGDAAAEERFKEMSARPTTCSATRPSARSTTRSASSARWAAGSARRAGRLRRPGGFDFNVGADGLGDLLGQCSVAAAAAAARRRPPVRSAGPTWRPTLTLDFADAAQRHHHHAAPHQRRAVLHLPRQRGQARHAAEGLLAVRRTWRDRREPGLLLVLLAVPRRATAPA